MSETGDRPQQPADAGDDAESGADQSDLRDQFRAALERKKANPAAGGGRSGKSCHAHSAPAKAKRTFRRKSG